MGGGIRIVGRGGVKPGKLPVGATVRFRFGVRNVHGRVVEDRGPIGVGGRRLYAVEFPLTDQEMSVVELPESEIEVPGI